MHAHELGAIDGEHAERVGLTQVVLRRERQLGDVGDRLEAALDARGQRPAIERHALGAARDDGAQALELELGRARRDRRTRQRDSRSQRAMLRRRPEQAYGPPFELSRVQKRSRCVGS